MTIEMQRLSVAELLAIYNFHTAPKVKRFESHAIGARRLRALLTKIEVHLDDAYAATFPDKAVEEYPDNGPTDPWQTSGPGVSQPKEAGPVEPDAETAGMLAQVVVSNDKYRAYQKAKAADSKVKPAKVPAKIAPAAEALPSPPDFTANTHKPYRAKLAKLIELANAGDVAGLEAFEIKPSSSSPKALIRYRDKVVAALKAQGAQA